MKRVIIESPYKGRVPVNEIYGELAMRDCLKNHKETPYASHLLYTRTFVLDDTDPEQRLLGIQAGFYWREVAEKTVFYVDLGLSEGMELGIEDCKLKRKPFAIRKLPDDLWELFQKICEIKGYGKQERVTGEIE